MNIQELIKGIIVGIAKIIPGFSGAVLLISFNLYERAINAITNFFSNPKKNFFFLFNLGIGVVIGIVFFSKIISYFIGHYYLYTMALFLGLIFGGIPAVFKKIQKSFFHYGLVILSFCSMVCLTLITPNYHYIVRDNGMDFLIFFIAGFLEALGTILPGISSTALLMLIGVYDYYILTLSNALNITLLAQTCYFLVPFSIGMFIGIVIISIIVNYLFKFYQSETFAIIFGVSLATILSLVVQLFPSIHGILSFLVAAIFLLIGYFLTYKLI